MKLSRLINAPLSWLGVKLVRLSSLSKLQVRTNVSPVDDIKGDTAFMQLFTSMQDKTMVGLERSYALYTSLHALLNQNIAGDIVECGVWKGGSCMLMAQILLQRGQTHRRIFLYDTFAGMTEPGETDGLFEKEEWKRLKGTNAGSDWCKAGLEEVKANMQSTGYPADNIVYVTGKVEDTIPATAPEAIALLRLDTDWYESTRHELQHLFPRLQQRGVLLIDDYGAWQGARKAVDEYFSESPYQLLRIDHSGRLLIKV